MKIKILIPTIILSCSTIFIYVWEKSRPVTDYFTYYFDVTDKLEYNHPELVQLYVFGFNANGLNPVIIFANSLFCKPIDNSSDYELIDITGADMEPEPFDYWNFINPNKVSRRTLGTARGVMNDRNVEFLLSRKAASDVRSAGTDEFGAWELGGGYPQVTSICYISTISTTKTSVFGFAKTQQSFSNEFKYIYPDTERAE